MNKENYGHQIVCPGCGYKHSDCYEYFSEMSDEDVDIQCAHCEIDLRVSRNISITYTTRILADSMIAESERSHEH